jgi:hypothetical protein
VCFIVTLITCVNTQTFSKQFFNQRFERSVAGKLEITEGIIRCQQTPLQRTDVIRLRRWDFCVKKPRLPECVGGESLFDTKWSELRIPPCYIAVAIKSRPVALEIGSASFLLNYHIERYSRSTSHFRHLLPQRCDIPRHVCPSTTLCSFLPLAPFCSDRLRMLQIVAIVSSRSWGRNLCPLYMCGSINQGL